MQPVSKTNEVIDGYVDLWQWWLDAWSTYAKSVTTKLEAGSYGTADATADMTAYTNLANESAMRVAVEGADAMAIYASDVDKPVVRMAGPFSTTAAPNGQRTLELAAPLSAHAGTLLLDSSRVSIRPSVLFKGETQFKIIVDTTMISAATYNGTVTVTDASGTTESVIVQVVAP